MKKINALCFFGTRPEAIKMAPVVRALSDDLAFQVRVAVSAQHREMLDQVLKAFRLSSHADLDVMRPSQTLFGLTSRVLSSFEPALQKLKPDILLVHGDTTTTLCGALAAYYLKIPVAHVEAGLRTNDLYRPFPEEANRRLVDAISTLHFAPTNESKRNLLAENLSANGIFVTGNTVIDALLSVVKTRPSIKDATLKSLMKKLDREGRQVILMTAHRRENFGKPFQEVCGAVQELAKKFPHMHWIYPVHPNPNVKEPARRFLKKLPNVHLLSPLDYTDLVNVLHRSALVLTDSGGLQEEAPSLGKPVLVLRDVTERPEAVKAGTVKLVGPHQDKITRSVSALLTNPTSYRRMATATNPYGDGKAADRIRRAIRWYFKVDRNKPDLFRVR